ncbi:M13-type metalloendopeptidase [Nocardia brasiliensis]|uniref:M13-type metalloendopeptidase n=1 Tax=Nocardia brasiliensis TaxID=37326 RepID=UPI003CC7FAB8
MVYPRRARWSHCRGPPDESGGGAGAGGPAGGPRGRATDTHSPAEFRCNQVVRNLAEFYTAFDVKETDKLFLPPDQRVTF